MSWKKDKFEHGLAAKGVRTKQTMILLDKSLHKKEKGYGEEIALGWVNNGAYSEEEEIKKLTNGKIIDDFYRYTSNIREYPSPSESPIFYKAAKKYLTGWLKYQKSHI